MAEKKRQCGTCRFFVEKEASGHGKCTHPKRAGTDAELLLLRPTELACRTKWGDSLWQDPADDTDPMEPKSPQQPSLPDPIAAQLQFDDEVTSVSIAGSKSSRSSFEDDVVDSGATVTGMASWNDPVQDERLDLLRKGSQDALAGARKRHMEKQARQRELIPFADDDETPKSESKPEPKQEPPAAEQIAERSNNFPPDDFVEEERSSADDDTFDDEMVDEGVTSERNRPPRIRKLLRNSNDPKKNEAMRMSMPSDMRVTSHNPEHREQWNSVPTLNPGFELPLSKSSAQPHSTPNKVAASAAPAATTSYQPSTVSQARELVSENRLRQERAQRQLVVPLIDDEAVQPEPTRSQSVTDRPRLTEAPASSAGKLERVKSSPLRGYHPATRKLIPPENREQQQTSQVKPTRREVARPEPQRTQQPANPQPAREAVPRQRMQSQPHQRPSAPQPRRSPDMQIGRQPEQPQPRRDEQVARERRRGTPQSLPEEDVFKHQEIEISPHLPVRCGTCTSYRPSGVEGRGSCNNGLAGPVQRVVYEDDVACQRSFGSFWIPADELVWLEELETDYPPTPRVDAMLARKRRRKNTVLPDLEELTS